MYKQLIEKDLKRIVQGLGFGVGDLVLSIPENSKFGDYSSNIPLQLAKQNTSKNNQPASPSAKRGESSQEIANQIIEKFGHPPYLERVEVAGPGFLNFFLKDQALLEGLGERGKGKETTNKIPKRILVEYASPNAFKEYHIGHLRNLIIGESVSRILEAEGNDVFRVTYTSDIGPAVSKVLFGIKQLGSEYEQAKQAPIDQKAAFLGKAYVLGTELYDSDPEIKKQIDELTIKLYKKDPEIKELWLETRDWSVSYLETIYSQMGTHFDAEIWESEVGEEGKQIVLDNLDKIFIKDQGAIIFQGEKYGLHTRVFINSAGNPMYEAKELGNVRREEELYPFDLAIHVIASEQIEYFKVVVKALELIDSRYIGKKHHLSYNFVNLSSGKMSSRKGNIISTDKLLELVKEEIAKSFESLKNSPDTFQKIATAAIKFTYLRYALNTEILFDIQKSISIQGDSGPYLLYTYARIQSVLNRATNSTGSGQAEMKASVDDIKIDPGQIAQFIRQAQDIEDNEREVLRLLQYFDSIVESASQKLQPNEIANYLLNLARSFNTFYEYSPVIGSEKQDFRLLLIKQVAEKLKNGLYLLGIETVDRM